MITSSDIENILYPACLDSFGLPVYRFGNTADGPFGEELVAIHAKSQSEDKIWAKCFVEVNIYVPDLPGDKADLIRLNTFEREAQKALHATGSYEGTPYHYRISSTEILRSKDHKCHFVNARVLFKTLNTIEN